MDTMEGLYPFPYYITRLSVKRIGHKPITQEILFLMKRELLLKRENFLIAGYHQSQIYRKNGVFQKEVIKAISHLGGGGGVKVFISVV